MFANFLAACTNGHATRKHTTSRRTCSSCTKKQNKNYDIIKQNRWCTKATFHSAVNSTACDQFTRVEARATNAIYHQLLNLEKYILIINTMAKIKYNGKKLGHCGCHVRCTGSKSASLLRTLCDSRSGNWMSNSTTMSPRFEGCFGCGRPSPWILRTIPGWTTESPVLSWTGRPPSVGTSTVLPISAWK